MPSLNEIRDEIHAEKDADYDGVRHKYLQELSRHTGRNVIAYYSGWLNNPDYAETAINDIDKNSFMATIYNLDRSKGLDLILHTPGGQISATESIVNYLHSMFDGDIRAIIPQIAMSAGTMIACSCNSIIMGKHSNLGPIDPQFGGLPAGAVIEEFEEALKQIKKDPDTVPLWQTIIGKYHPTFLGECEKAISWSDEIVKDWLVSCMLKDKDNKENIADTIVSGLSNHSETKTHSRHIHMEQCKDLGLHIIDLEDDQVLQDLVLSVHHSYMVAFSDISGIMKIVENQNEIRNIQRQNIPQ